MSMKVLYITANPKEIKDSVCLSLGEVALNEFKAKHPQVEVTTLDVCANEYAHINGDTLKDYMNPHGLCGLAATDFVSYDYFIVVAPMWNLTVPSALKAFWDTVIIPNITFRYNEQGRTEGLCKGSMLYIGARGGDYSSEFLQDIACDDRMMKGIAGMIGCKYQSYVANGVGGYRQRSVADWVDFAANDVISAVGEM
ncbi:hypothetical protein FM037_09430 [Shewanella psychropiezotolerans]|uniref:Flavodoxin-like fold domain-containing protein n=2 Tax=Shewanella psychropiezotolerans TaxID=2593655 RepID=A0ABX5WWE6_9GAMM|nr:hypothetical protein FM037_09430 [Shewanella psychropiezotolerans]